ncbi:MAG: hypothetical protein WDN30_01780 [Pararobbsia sp.]
MPHDALEDEAADRRAARERIEAGEGPAERVHFASLKSGAPPRGGRRPTTSDTGRVTCDV